MLKSLLFAILLLMLGVGVLFYIALRSHKLDVSDREPFRALIGQETLLRRDMQLVRVREPERMDGSDELWERDRAVSAEQQLIAALDSGTPIVLRRAMLFKGGTSGTTHAVVFGTARVGGKKQEFAVYWGEYHFLFEERPYWTFPAAPWDRPTPQERYPLPPI